MNALLVTTAVGSNVLAGVALAFFAASRLSGHPQDFPLFVLAAMAFVVCAVFALIAAVLTAVRFNRMTPGQRVLGMEPLLVAGSIVVASLLW